MAKSVHISAPTSLRSIAAWRLSVSKLTLSSFLPENSHIVQRTVFTTTWSPPMLCPGTIQVAVIEAVPEAFEGLNDRIAQTF